MMNMIIYAVLLFFLVIFIASAIKIYREYERGVIFTLGRFTGVKGPGLIIVIPFIQQAIRIDTRTIVLDVPTQDVISRDNVSVKVNAVLYFRVVDPGTCRAPGRKLHDRDQPACPNDVALGAWQTRVG